MRKKSKIHIITLLFALIISALQLIAVQPQVTVSADDSTFSIMQISDTQFLSASKPQLFTDTTNWIVNNAASYNLKMVIHTGDIVDNTATTSDPTQWANADASMSVLLSAGIPYTWDAGNHDQTPWNDATGTWLGSSYQAFDLNTMRSKPFWVSDFNNGKNTAVTFTCNGYQFLIVNVEYMATASGLTWMQNLLNNNLDKNVIVAAHTYLNRTGGYGFSAAGLPGENAWCANFKTILDGYPNVFLTLNGHDPSGSAFAKRVGDRQEIFFNRQVITTTTGPSPGQTGAAAVRIYTFDLSTKNVNTQTYDVYGQSWLTTAANQFSFTTNLKLPINNAVPEIPIIGTVGASIAMLFGFAYRIKRKTK
jgi:hypothetical protein